MTCHLITNIRGGVSMRCKKCEERRRALKRALSLKLAKAAKRLRGGRGGKGNILTCVLLVFTITGCSTVQVAAKLTADEICDLSVKKRAAVRALVDEATEPHIVRVECRW